MEVDRVAATAPFEVRAARLSDVPTLLEMWLASATLHQAQDPEFYELAPSAETEMRGYWEGVLADATRRAFVAESAGTLVGCIQADLRAVRVFSRAHRGFIFNLWVEPAHRRRGVGRRLMGAAERWLRGAGAELIILNVGVHNAEALAFYEALDYRPASLNLVRFP